MAKNNFKLVKYHFVLDKNYVLYGYFYNWYSFVNPFVNQCVIRHLLAKTHDKIAVIARRMS